MSDDKRVEEMIARLQEQYFVGTLSTDCVLLLRELSNATPLDGNRQTSEECMGLMREIHDRLGSMIDQVGQPDYSLREMVQGMREIRDSIMDKLNEKLHFKE